MCSLGATPGPSNCIAILFSAFSSPRALTYPKPEITKYAPLSTLKTTFLSDPVAVFEIV